eukprot:TRINITY_DN179_c0_g1_i1.p1 TRINITY_DN179_c0_g1~~TRINITY_DN179_c0_g1_i1.p1  ORF type:complete len:290 (+),score=102.82 TRINITY_DN179_c0_g1_i1:45-914(+)
MKFKTQILFLSLLFFYYNCFEQKTNLYGSFDPNYYSNDTARQYLFLSYGAYCNYSSLEDWNCKWCNYDSVVSNFRYTNSLYDQKTDTFGFVGYNPTLNQIIVTFRGSQSMQNWITNLNLAKMTPYPLDPNSQVHEGFYEAWLTVRSDTFKAVNNLRAIYPSYPVIFTGHSLGAALSVLAASEMSTQIKNVYVWNFGQPRVGNQGWVDFYANLINIIKTFRVVNERDLVPHSPPMALQFRQEPREVWYTQGQIIQCDPNNGEDFECSDSLTVTLSVEDHLNYLSLYEECV